MPFFFSIIYYLLPEAYPKSFYIKLKYILISLYTSINVLNIFNTNVKAQKQHIEQDIVYSLYLLSGNYGNQQ